MTSLEDELRATASKLFSNRDRHLTLGQLRDLGWFELMDEEPQAAVSVLAEEQGRHLGTSRLVELILASQLDQNVDVEVEAIVIPVRAEALPDVGEIDGVVLRDAPLETLILPVADPSGRVVLRRGRPDGLTPVLGIDPDAGWTRIEGASFGEPVVLPDDAWARASALGSLALSYETLGGVDAMLQSAVAHAKDRHQFGVPIGTFQAVAHRLADVHVALEAARSVAETAWVDRDPLLCSAALAAARRASFIARTNCQQVLGAMGCTWEHDLHRHIRRDLLLGVLFDPEVDLARAVDTVIQSERRTEVLA
jgi:Acyl-CoA dehydrogenase, C-terminal domain